MLTDQSVDIMAIGESKLDDSFPGISLPTSLSELFNRCVMFLHFPVNMKLDEISPVFKKIDSLCKDNHRSVNILTVTSKML